MELSKKTTAQKNDLAKTIVAKMTGNASFTTPNPILASITTAVNNLSTATADLVAARKILEAKMSTVALAESLLDNLRS